MRKIVLGIFTALCIMTLPAAYASSQTNLMLIFDASGSMWGQIEAKAGGGEYFPAKDAGKLKEALMTVIEKTVEKICDFDTPPPQNDTEARKVKEETATHAALPEKNTQETTGQNPQASAK